MDLCWRSHDHRFEDTRCEVSARQILAVTCNYRCAAVGVGNGAVVWAEQTIPSGLTAVFVTTMPFWMIGVDAMLPDGERLTWRHLVGLSIGFSGMAALLWPEIRLGGAGRGLTGAIATQIACAGWAIGSAYARRRCWVDNLPENAALQMMFGGLGLLVVGLLRGEPAAFGVSGRSLGALAYLTLVGSIGGFLAYMYALKHLPISFVSLYSYVNPLIAFPLGALVLQEPLTWRTVASSAIVVAGVAVVRREQQRLAATSRTPAPPDNAAST